MKKIAILFVLTLAILAISVTASAQTNSAVSGSIWFDGFAGSDGGVIYPQYAFRLGIKPVTFTGYGFLEEAPQEPLFTNHVNTVTANRFHQFSIRTETGGNVENGNYFFQTGPQANIHEIVRPIKKAMSYLIVAQLPKLAGLRPPNTLIAGGTRSFHAADSFNVSAEGYYRFFPGGRPDYGEFWLLAHPKKIPHLSFGAFALIDGGKAKILFGGRIAL